RCRREPGSSVRRQLRVERPEASHRHTKRLVGLRLRIRDHPREFRHPNELELEWPAFGEVGAHALEVGFRHLGGRHPGVMQSQRDGNRLGDPLGIELSVRLGQFGIAVLEVERDRGLERTLRHQSEVSAAVASRSRRGVTSTATTTPMNAAIAAIAKAPSYPRAAGTLVPGIRCAVRIAAPTSPPMTPPTVRATVFIPVATPVSVALTASVIRVAIAAKAKPMPMPSTARATRICHVSVFQNASISAETPESSIPAASGHFDPIRRPLPPAEGPAKSRVNELRRQ